MLLSCVHIVFVSVRDDDNVIGPGEVKLFIFQEVKNGGKMTAIRVASEVLAVCPTALVLALGISDTWPPRSLESYRREMNLCTFETESSKT